MLKKIFRRLHSDRGDSELITALFILPIILGVLFTTIDAAIYFNNRAAVQSVARDGARTVAIFGGNGLSDGRISPIQKQYGQITSTACAGVGSMPRVSKAFNSGSTATECNIMKDLSGNKSLVNIEVVSVKCDPDLAGKISDRTSCSVKWNYNSIPASALTVIRQSPDRASRNGLTADNTTIGTSESEVSMNGVNFVSPNNNN